MRQSNDQDTEEPWQEPAYQQVPADIHQASD